MCSHIYWLAPAICFSKHYFEAFFHYQCVKSLLDINISMSNYRSLEFEILFCQDCITIMTLLRNIQ